MKHWTFGIVYIIIDLTLDKFQDEVTGQLLAARRQRGGPGSRGGRGRGTGRGQQALQPNRVLQRGRGGGRGRAGGRARGMNQFGEQIAHQVIFFDMSEL